MILIKLCIDKEKVNFSKNASVELYKHYVQRNLLVIDMYAMVSHHTSSICRMNKKVGHYLFFLSSRGRQMRMKLVNIWNVLKKYLKQLQLQKMPFLSFKE